MQAHMLMGLWLVSQKNPPPTSHEICMSALGSEQVGSAAQAAIDSYRNDCEHPKPAYATLNGTGAGRYDAACTSCQS